MSRDELAKNLGTIARSGTSEFLKKVEEGGGADGNLIGQFGKFLHCEIMEIWLKELARSGLLQLVGVSA